MVWTLLFVNTLGYTAAIDLIIPFPKIVAQVIAMGLLVVAFGLALVLNPRVRIRPNAYLLLLTLMALVAVASSLRLESGTGAVLRCLRLLLFLATLWLLTVWWRGDLRIVRTHVGVLAAVLLTVVVGLVVSPGSAFSGPDGRLVGALWPIPPPQVGMYSAVVIGLCFLLWMNGALTRSATAVLCVPAVGLLLLSHTRTALLGLVVGLVVAGASMLARSARARRVLGAGLAAAAVTAVFLGAAVQEWLTRGQDESELTNLTGRTKVWDLLLARERTAVEQWIGVGLTDKSFAGLPIDNTWLTVYNELGWTGVVLAVMVLAGLLVTVVLRPPSAQRVCALFLVVYCCVASYTEVELGDATPYLLNLGVAAALLVRPAAPARARPEVLT